MRASHLKEFFLISPSEALSQISMLLKCEPYFINEINYKKFEHFSLGYKSQEKKAIFNDNQAPNICPKCLKEMRNLKKGGFKCIKCGALYR